LTEKEVVEMPEITMKGYRLLWFVAENRGEVQLYVNPDAQPDITIKVQSASELVAWDTLLSQRDMRKLAAPDQGGPVIIHTDPKQIS
jgi:hypothetical protein